MKPAPVALNPAVNAHQGRETLRCGLMFAFLSAMHVAIAGCSYTAPFRDAEGHTIPESIATMEMATIGGVRQSLWFRGVAQSKPALILLHGGPGVSESALFRHYDAALEQHFLVVYWEQRGTGRSCHADIPPESMTIAQFERDLDEVVEGVRQRFGKDKVVLLGHSWGTVPGIIYAAKHPEKVAAYVGVAQIADVPRGRRLSYQFALSEAQRRNDADAIAELTRIGPPPYASVEEGLAVGKWIERFGGEFHGDLSKGKLIWAALSTDEATLIDLIKFGQGNRFSLEQLEDEISKLKLSAHYRSFDVPVFFFLGRYDWNVPSALAQEYFQAIQAPCKRLVWFEQSAHNPPFEEPDAFVRVLVDEVLPFANGTSASCTRLQRQPTCTSFRSTAARAKHGPCGVSWNPVVRGKPVRGKN